MLTESPLDALRGCVTRNFFQLCSEPSRSSARLGISCDPGSVLVVEVYADKTMLIVLSGHEGVVQPEPVLEGENCVNTRLSSV